MHIYHNLRLAFTQIELIFVILIIGILAVTAVPRLLGSRDDAKLAMDVSNMFTCLNESNIYYLVHSKHLPVGYSSLCDSVKCFNTTEDGAKLIVNLDANTISYCSDVADIGGHLAKTYRF